MFEGGQTCHGACQCHHVLERIFLGTGLVETFVLRTTHCAETDASLHACKMSLSQRPFPSTLKLSPSTPPEVMLRSGSIHVERVIGYNRINGVLVQLLIYCT